MDLQSEETQDSLDESEESEYAEESVASEDEYGGRGEPEAASIVLIESDVIEFKWEGTIYTGVVQEINSRWVTVKHLDSKYYNKVFQYKKKDFYQLPNWVTIKDNMQSESITKFEDLHLYQRISFCSVDVDDSGASIARQWVILGLGKKNTKFKLVRLSRPSKPNG